MNIVAVLVLGLSPGAAALAGYISFFVGVFQHMNVRTPQWLGFVIQRPEAHAVHHTRGVHAYNYGNFMLWDILFGTFRNPATFAAGRRASGTAPRARSARCSSAATSASRAGEPSDGRARLPPRPLRSGRGLSHDRMHHVTSRRTER